MKKHTPKNPICNDDDALQAARKADAIANSKKLYANANEITGMSTGQRVSVMMAAKQLVKVATMITKENTTN